VRRFFAVLLLLGASCGTAEVKETDGARKTFEEWARVTADGDVEKNLSMLSDAFKSQWIYLLLEENDPPARRWRGSLTGVPRTDLDLWWGVAHGKRDGRIEPLRTTVLEHPSFHALYREYFERNARGIKAQFAKLEVLKIYGDSTGITVNVRCGAGSPTEMYGMIFDGGWKIDTYKEGLGSPR
jgi:hypothetical protein